MKHARNVLAMIPKKETKIRLRVTRSKFSVRLCNANFTQVEAQFGQFENVCQTV